MSVIHMNMIKLVIHYLLHISLNVCPPIHIYELIEDALR